MDFEVLLRRPPKAMDRSYNAARDPAYISPKRVFELQAAIQATIVRNVQGGEDREA